MTSGRRPLRRRVAGVANRATPALFVLATIVALAGAPIRSQDEPTGATAPQASIMARLAPRSLLLDAVERGPLWIAVGERGHILVSRDGATTWTQAPVPTRVMLTGIWMHDDRLGWAVGHDETILRTRRRWRLLGDGVQRSRCRTPAARRLVPRCRERLRHRSLRSLPRHQRRRNDLDRASDLRRRFPSQSDGGRGRRHALYRSRSRASVSLGRSRGDLAGPAGAVRRLVLRLPAALRRIAARFRPARPTFPFGGPRRDLGGGRRAVPKRP